MPDDARELTRQLDLLLSIHRDHLTELQLAELLYATANGLITLLGEHPKWDGANHSLSIPFTEASALESELEPLLSTRVICVPAKGLPMLADIDVRIVAGTESMVLRGRTIQETAAGVVIQLQPADVAVQRALVGLPAVLRSNPTEPLVVNKRAIRPPLLIPPKDAQLELFPPPPPPPAPPPVVVAPAVIPTSAPSPSAPAPVPATTTVRRPAGPVVEHDVRPEEPATQERLANSRLAFNRPKIEAAVARIGQRSHFDFLSIHFSADRAEAAAARDALLETIAQCREDDRDEALVDTLSRLDARIAEAWAVLRDTKPRRSHRAEVVAQFKIETAAEMYERQAESALLSRKIDIAVDCYRRIVELDPTHNDARINLEALMHLENE